jgi:hypothetical protein
MTWIDTLIAAFVAAVVYFQWRTAHQPRPCGVRLRDCFSCRIPVLSENLIRPGFAS